MNERRPAVFAEPQALTLLHGAHNRFAILDERPPHRTDYSEIGRRICAEHDLDGLLIVRESIVRDAPGDADIEMLIVNRDGSESEMCGNGIRCIVRYLAERGEGDSFVIATRAGAVPASVIQREPVFRVRAALGEVTFPLGLEPQILRIGGTEASFIAVSVGNPHAVFFVDRVDEADLPALAAGLARDARFPSGVNVHVAQRDGPSTARARHFERGVGETQACGSGAVAIAAAAIALHNLSSPVDVTVPGGRLRVRWQAGEPAELEGPVERIGIRTLQAG